MADHIVPPRKKKPVIIKCWKCHTMYVTKCGKWGEVEPCPYCHTQSNDRSNQITLWAYNLIKYWRSMFECEEIKEDKTDG